MRAVTHAGRAASVALLVLAVASCGPADPISPGAAPTTTPPSSSRTPSPGTSPAVARTVTVSGARSYRVPFRDLGLFALTGKWLAFTAAPSAVPGDAGGERQSTRLVVLDRDTGKIRVLASTAFPGGRLLAVSASDGWVFWTDQSANQSDPNGPVRWTVWGQNLTTGVRRKLAQSSEAGDALVPEPAAAGGHVAWTQWLAPAKTTSDVYVHDLASGRTRKVMTSVRVGQVKPSRDALVYLLTTPVPDGYTDTVYIRPLAGGPARPLSTSGHAIDVAFTDGVAAWQEPDTGEPVALVARPIDATGAPFLLAGPGRSWVRLGRRFAVDLASGSGGWEARPLGAGGTPVPLSSASTCVPCGIAVDANTVAWGELPNPDDLTQVVLHTATVTG